MRSSTQLRLPAYRQSVAGTLLAAREAVMAPIRPKLREANVTEQQWRVLRVLSDEPSIDARGLADAALLYAPSVTRILKELGDRGLIERRTHEKDGRRSVIAITRAGRELVDETAAHTLKILAGYERRFGPERLAALMREVAAFADAIGDAKHMG